MAWTAPKTFQATELLTAAFLNTYLRDNMLETGPAKATRPGGYMVATGLNAIAERLPDVGRVNTSETRTSTSYGDLATVGPSVTVTTGTRALVMISCRIHNTTSNAFAAASYAISGATTSSASDSRGIQIDGTTAANYIQIGDVDLNTTLTAGSNTFTMKYRVDSGTGTFHYRRIVVLPF